jgi:hypothetical protein
MTRSRQSDIDDSQGPLVIVNNRSPEDAPDPPTDWGPLLEYLKTQQGHEVAGRVLGLFEGLQKAAVVRGSSLARWDKMLQAVTIAAVLICGTILAALGKFTGELGIVLVALLGYVLRKPT